MPTRQHLRYAAVMTMIIVSATITKADSWTPAHSSFTYSENHKYSGLVTPSNADNPGTLEVFKEISTTKNEPTMESLSEEYNSETSELDISFWKKACEKWKNNKNRKPIWKVTLTNSTAPLDVLISNNGENVVTLDNVYCVGSGDDVIAFYNKKGLIKKYSLDEAIQDIPLPPDPEEEELRELFGDDYEEDNSIFSRSNLPFQKSITSLWWRQDGISLLYESEGKTILCIWLDWADKWLSWDVTTGVKYKTVDALIPKITTKACNIFRKEIDNFDGYWQPFIEAPILFLAKQKHAEDRFRIEKLLQNKGFNTSLTSSDKKIDCFSAESSIRKPADWALSIWDGKRKNTEKYDEYSDQAYFYLGNAAGFVILPEKPKESEKVWLYLILSNISESNWKQFTPVHILEMDFDWPGLIYEKKIPFEFLGVTPGSYWIKCVWDRGEPYSKDSPNSQTKPSKGDYESKGRLDTKIEAGIKVENIVIDQFVEVK